MRNEEKVKSKRIAHIVKQIAEECSTLSMDDQTDRAKMAEWIELNFKQKNDGN